LIKKKTLSTKRKFVYLNISKFTKNGHEHSEKCILETF
jgi:hypothetical protein